MLIVSAVALAAWLRLGEHAWTVLSGSDGFWKVAIVALVAQGTLYYADLYDERVTSDRRELVTRILQALGAASIILALVYYWFPALIIGRGVFMLTALMVSTFVLGWRVAFEWLSGHVAPRERLLLVGTNDAAISLARELFERR